MKSIILQQAYEELNDAVEYVIVHQHLIFVRFGLLTYREYASKTKTNEYKALVNDYGQ